MTIHARVTLARQRLTDAGLSAAEAGISARVLAQHVLGWDAARLIANGSDPESAAFVEQYEPLIDRRILREPVAYLTGYREFWGLEFEVSPAVLIPRPDTEIIVEAVRALLPDREQSLQIVDVGTGSGCLAVSLAREYPLAQIVATDISEDALDMARRNATRHQVQDRISFVKADLLDGVNDCFDVVVSNPPYVVESDRPALQPEVRDHEPHVALFGGRDGAGIIRRLLETAPKRLRAGGLLLFEFGLGQADRITELVSAVPALHLVEFRDDIQGIQRVAVCREGSRPSVDAPATVS